MADQTLLILPGCFRTVVAPDVIRIPPKAGGRSGTSGLREDMDGTRRAFTEQSSSGSSRMALITCASP
jgi:hypothetical protein